MTDAPNFLGLDPSDSDLDTATAVILPVPYDATSTWKKGADRGPGAILRASTAVELYDIPTRSEPWRQGIATLPPIHCGTGPEKLAAQVEAAVDQHMQSGRLPIVLGGEHSVSIGAIRAAARRFPNLTVLQVDAHADTRESYEGSTCNHACVMARAREVASIVQVGIRSVDVSEIPGLDPDRVFWAHDIVADGSDDWIATVSELLTDHVYLTVDLDGFDPSVVPATGTPEPGGLSWRHVERLVQRVAHHRTIVGFDVVELLPHEAHWASDFLAAKLVHRILAEILSAR
jgi:agmatinase